MPENFVNFLYFALQLTIVTVSFSMVLSLALEVYLISANCWKFCNNRRNILVNCTTLISYHNAQDERARNEQRDGIFTWTDSGLNLSIPSLGQDILSLRVAEKIRLSCLFNLGLQDTSRCRLSALL